MDEIEYPVRLEDMSLKSKIRAYLLRYSDMKKKAFILLETVIIRIGNII